MKTSLYPEPVVGAFIFNRKGEVLLVQSHKWKGNLWVVCGGHIELGETIAEALRREFSEEVGLQVSDVSVFAVFDRIYSSHFSRKKHFIFIECRCTTDQENVSIDHDEIQNAVWVNLTDACNYNLEDSTRKALEILRDSIINKHTSLLQ